MRLLAPCLAGIVLTVAACADDPHATLPTETTGPSEPTVSLETTGPSEPTRSPWPTELTPAHQDWTVRVIDRVPHDPTAFTQGLEVGDAGVFESTGREGESTLRLVDPETGETLLTRALDPDRFGEGLTRSGDELIQLTWRSGVALRYDAHTLEPLGEFRYDGEGWGLCATDAELWMSNGSAELIRRDPTTFAPQGTVIVKRSDIEIGDLNELECIGDHVVANIWKSDEIVVIDPTTGAVVATIDASELADEIGTDDASAVLNGIADRGDGTLLLGGKLWPTFFVVEVVTP